MGQVTTMGLGRVAMVRDFLRGALTDALFMATAIDNTGILSLLEAQDTLYIYIYAATPCGVRFSSSSFANS